MMKRWLKIFFIWLLTARAVAGEPVNATDTDLSASRAVDALLGPFDRADAPGVSVGVFRAGEIIYRKAAGMADIKRGTLLTTHSVFDIASMSKQFTAFTVVLLQEDGRLSLDDDVRKYIPEVHTDGRKMTIRQFLQHTSGIRDYLDLMELAGKHPYNSVISQNDILAVISAQRTLNFNPGDAFRYENTSYALMATLVQRVSGTSLKQFAGTRIFSPLDMRSTLFRDNHSERIENRVCGYEPAAKGWNEVTPIYDEVGDGGVWTTIEDLAKWDANFYQPRVGGTNAIQLLLSQAILNNGLKMSYALGLFVEDYHGFKMVSHGGVDPGYRAQMLRFPDEKLTVAVLANNPAYDVERLARQIADIYLPKSRTAAKIQPASKTNGDWTRLSGKYLDETTGRLREIVVGNKGLVLRSRGRDYPLTTVDTDVFLDPSDGSRVQFTDSSTNGVQMTMTLDGQMPAICRQLPSRPVRGRTSDYAGAYVSPELGVTWTVISAGSNVKLKRVGVNETLSILDKDTFVADPGLISFFRDKDRRVVAFKLTNVRDSNIEFRRSLIEK